MVGQGSDKSPFFTFADISILTSDRFVREVRAALAHAGVDCSAYAGHSFRIGSATTAAIMGCPRFYDQDGRSVGELSLQVVAMYVATPHETLTPISRT